MFARDRSRAADAIRRMDECPLGAAALAGTGFAIDRKQTAKALGFREPTRNSLDSVSDRDFALDFLVHGFDLRNSSFASGRGNRYLVHTAIWFRPPVGPFFNRLVDHAAKEKP